MTKPMPTSPVRREPTLVSVVMPCFNSERYLRAAVDSVLAQTYPHVELVAVDDGSSDGTRQILATYGSRITVLGEPNRGPYPARNLAMRHARGEFIAFLDADDYWLPDALSKLHGALASADADIAYCGWQNVGDGVTAEPYVPPPYEQGDAVEAFLRTCPWPIHAALVRRTIVDRLGGFSEQRFSAMDYDFWLRALALTRNIVRVPEVLAFYRWHDAGQISAVKWRQVLDALAVQQDFVRANPHLVAHLPTARLRELTERRVVQYAYRALWKRDLASAHRLFRHVALARSFDRKEWRHVASALLPFPAYRWLVGLADRGRS